MSAEAPQASAGAGEAGVTESVTELVLEPISHWPFPPALCSCSCLEPGTGLNSGKEEKGERTAKERYLGKERYLRQRKVLRVPATLEYIALDNI